MTEEQLKQIIEEITEPLKQEHLKFMETIISQLENAFIVGMEVGQRIKKEE